LELDELQFITRFKNQILLSAPTTTQQLRVSHSGEVRLHFLIFINQIQYQGFHSKRLTDISLTDMKLYFANQTATINSQTKPIRNRQFCDRQPVTACIR